MEVEPRLVPNRPANYSISKRRFDYYSMLFDRLSSKPFDEQIIFATRTLRVAHNRDFYHREITPNLIDLRQRMVVEGDCIFACYIARRDNNGNVTIHKVINYTADNTPYTRTEPKIC